MKIILLVNTQGAFLDRNKSLLNRAGFRILTATCAEEALNVCRNQPINLIISQLDMPGMAGDQFCSLIRQEPEIRSVSIILVAYSADLERASNCGANAVVTKPVRPDLLLKLVEKFLGIQARREHRAILNARVEGISGSLVFSGMTRNISVTGLLCESAVPLNRNDLLSNLAFLVNSHQIVADGRVVWSAGLPDGQYTYGVRFINLDPDLKDKIEQFVEAPETL